jgi:hypothetical protein
VKKVTLVATFVLIVTSSAAMACAPAPSCWMKSDRAYLRSVCEGYRGRTLKQIAQYVEEPEKVPAFAKACRQFNINLKE